jgi:tetratricopeptide (TPR) repeat protein
MALNDLGNRQSNLGLESDALRTQERSLEIRRRVAAENPGVPEYQKELGIGLMNCGGLKRNAGRIAEAMPLFEEARGLYERLVRQYPDVADYRFRLSGVFSDIGSVHEVSGRIDEAFQAAQKARGLMEGAVRDHPEDLSFRFTLAWTLCWIGQIYHRRTDHQAEAIPYYRRAIELLEQLVRENPEMRKYPVRLAYGYCYLGQVLRKSGRETEASDMSRKALALFERIDTAGMVDLYDLACIRSLSSKLVRSDGPSTAAEARSRRLADQAVEALRQCIAGGYQDLTWIEKDTDLDPLRSRDDFKALIAGLEAQIASSRRLQQTAASP